MTSAPARSDERFPLVLCIGIMLEFVFAAVTMNAQSDAWVLGTILHILVVPSVWGVWLGRLSGGLRPWAWALVAPTEKGWRPDHLASR